MLNLHESDSSDYLRGLLHSTSAGPGFAFLLHEQVTSEERKRAPDLRSGARSFQATSTLFHPVVPPEHSTTLGEAP